jgi:ribonuclease HI
MMEYLSVSPEMGFISRSNMHRIFCMCSLYIVVLYTFDLVSLFFCMHEFCLNCLYFSFCFNAHMTPSFPIYFRFVDGASQHAQNITSAAWFIYHSIKLVSSRGIFLRYETNNVAEYHSIIKLLTKASSLGISQLIINLDSQLVVHQLNHEYVIHKSTLLCLHLRVCCLKRYFEFLEYKNIPRELNTITNSLVNYMLDWYIVHR